MKVNGLSPLNDKDLIEWMEINRRLQSMICQSFGIDPNKLGEDIENANKALENARAETAGQVSRSKDIWA